MENNPTREQPPTTMERPTLPGAAASPAADDSQSTLPPAVTTPGQLPEQFGRYRILQLLGKGGMGTVYLAHDTQLDRQVALKVPHFGPNDDAKVLERFHREARVAATLDHPHLCPVYDVGQLDGRHYLTMPFIDGKPLSALVRAHGGLPERQVAELVRKLALALETAHQKGVIHRDLKPANVMINRRGEPIIMDFGLARRANPDEVRLTHNNALVGTPAYMAPEQISAGEQTLGPSCDVYSLGVILYELLTGRLPFDGTMTQVLCQIVLDPPPPPSRLRPGLDPRLEDVCLAALAKKPAERYRGMIEFAQALERYLRDEDPIAVVLPADVDLAGPMSDPADQPWPTTRVLPAKVDPATPIRGVGAAQTSELPLLDVQSVEEAAPPAAPSSASAGWAAWWLRRRRIIVAGVGVVLLVLLVVTGWYAWIWTTAQLDWLRQSWSQMWQGLSRESDWVTLGNNWRAPPASAGPELLFPQQVAEFQREAHDDQAAIPEYDIQRKGLQGRYGWGNHKFEVFAYRADRDAREAVFQHVYDAFEKQKENSHRFSGSPKQNHMALSHGPFKPQVVLWWQDDWLFLIRSQDSMDLEETTKAYLRAISKAGP